MQLAGLHHVTAISADIRNNYRFYTRVMGMRLVKRSVNQDDVSAYHLFYADGAGSPGTDLTFFDWNLPRERRGNRSFTRTSLRLHGDASFDYWEKRLSEAGVPHDGSVERDGRRTLDFEDPEGQRLALVDDGGDGDPPTPWDRSPVPAEHQIRGLGPVLMSVQDARPTDLILTRVMNMRQVRNYHLDSAGSLVSVYEMGGGGAHAEVHLIEEPNVPVAQSGAGAVHHVAFRAPTYEDHEQWLQRLLEFRIPNSGEVDRYYFKSLYFREPNGLLFEIASDEPGFAVDEDPETLGEEVVLPPFLEPRREEILANLKPID